MIRILSGAGRYADPYHEFAVTSARVAGLIAGTGRKAEVVEDVEGGLADLTGVELLVVNVGDPQPHGSESAELPAARAGFAAYMAGGGSLLALHVSATSFPTVPEWEEILGGRWVKGQSMHPPYDHARVLVNTGAHEIVETIGDFSVWDERYSHLRVSAAIRPLAYHRHDGVEHPLLWAREHHAGRVVYDALGHDERSYDSPEHRAILIGAVDWLTR
ncbi:ThuA domain-containing protein [Nonomuraea sp. PA05]|uniref:ThuA domain-containing protein n=1 Tax=Nonomuraea sp. PA05 TaxID=2604466 RepID=UPI0011D484CE|nr:ThuA domain-containing protein [Nonomuraea sp. PA05]TYB56974.1 ThuA domain-containing protein [Nonomuraea sp. PA05]